MESPFKTPIRVEDGLFLVGDDCELILNASAATDEELAEIVKRVNAYDRLLEAAALVSQALGEVENIEQAAPLMYADDPSITGGYRANFDRPYNARRPYTLKDARPRARCAAKLLREAWELLDPPMTRTTP